MNTEDYYELSILYFLMPIVGIGALGMFAGLKFLILVIDLGIIAAIVYFLAWIFRGNKNYLFASIFIVISAAMFYQAVSSNASAIQQIVPILPAKEAAQSIFLEPILTILIGLLYAVPNIFSLALTSPLILGAGAITIIVAVLRSL